MLQYVSNMLDLIDYLLVPCAIGVLFAAGTAYRRHKARSSGRSERQQQRAHAIEHVLRLAAEIREVTLTIESDLAPFRSIPTFMRLQTRARRIRARAEAILSARDRLRDLPWFELETQVATVHTEHLRMVEVRAVADVEVKDWRKHVRRETAVVRSSWPFVSTPLNTSGLDL